MKIYIAGKIAGDRRYRAKFREAAKAMEAAGHVVLNPATLPDGLTDGDYMRICMAMVDAADLAVFWHTGNEPATPTACRTTRRAGAPWWNGRTARGSARTAPCTWT